MKHPPAGRFHHARRLHSGTSWPKAKPYPRSHLRYRIAIGPHVVLEPLDFIARLAALVPRP